MKNAISCSLSKLCAARCLIASIAVLLILASVQMAHAAEPGAEPVLALTFAGQQQQLTRAALLRHPAGRTITVPDDVAYKRPMTYRAIPLKSLLRDLRSSKTVQFKAKDGFVATIPASVLSGPSEPWLAIETVEQPWPALKPGGRSAGAFYLVWLSPEKSGISTEQWPYQIAAIGESTALEDRYPKILPGPTSGSAEHRGMQAYVTHCASCHQINGGGDARIGPDLNLPFNPTEYFADAYLRKYIRNPASVRTWPNMTMPGFSQTVMDDAQLEDLLAYLRNMTKRR